MWHDSVENTAFHFCGVGYTTRTGNPSNEVSGPAATEKKMPSPRRQSKLSSFITEKIMLLTVRPVDKSDGHSAVKETAPETISS